MIYVQKIFNTEKNSYVYYSSPVVTATPDINTTSPITLDLGDLLPETHSVISSSGGSGISVLDDGTPLTATVSSIDFLGGIASALGDSVTVDGLSIPSLTGTNYAVLMESPPGTLVWKKVPEAGIVSTFEITSFSKTGPDGTLLFRRGTTVTGITAAATYIESQIPTSASIANSPIPDPDVQVGDVNPGVWTINSPFATASLAGSVKRNGSDLGADPVMTVTLTATNEVTDYASFSLQWTRDVYYGVGSAGINTEAGIEALAGTTLATTRVRNIIVSPSSQKVYYAYPKSYGAATFTLDGFPASFTGPIEVSIENVNNITSTYFVYESEQLLTGTNLNFVVT